MTELRKQFEALHHIESMMKLCGAEYHAITRTYKIESTGLNDREVCSFVNGAWYALQEQQKKIDLVLQYIHDEKWMDEYGDYHCPVLKIQEILK